MLTSKLITHKVLGTKMNELDQVSLNSETKDIDYIEWDKLYGC